MVLGGIRQYGQERGQEHEMDQYPGRIMTNKKKR
jgi:hypothetical protein